MRTIEKILWYTPISDYNIELLRKWGFYNGTGADWVFFDKIIDDIFDILEEAKIFDATKKYRLRKDIEQLVIRHDIDIGFRIGFRRANKRLSRGLSKLLHKFSWKYRFTISNMVFYAVHYTEKARNNYYKKNV